MMKVKYLPFQPHCFAFGGFDMQMLNTLNAVRKAGIDASPLDVWSRDDDFEILHFWGISESNYNTINWAKKKDKKLIATVLLSYFDTLRLKIGYWYHIKSARFTDLRKSLSLLDVVVVLNEVQADVLNFFYKVPSSKIICIPNVVNAGFFEYKDDNFFLQKYNLLNNYVLCTGNISHRKNQYNLALACNNLNIKLVLIGNTLDGEKEYSQR